MSLQHQTEWDSTVFQWWSDTFMYRENFFYSSKLLYTLLLNGRMPNKFKVYKYTPLHHSPLAPAPIRGVSSAPCCTHCCPMTAQLHNQAVVKNAGGTAVVELTHNDEKVYWQEVQQWESWCRNNNIFIYEAKTKELIMDLCIRVYIHMCIHMYMCT